jgi:hypothetical protein
MDNWREDKGFLEVKNTSSVMEIATRKGYIMQMVLEVFLVAKTSKYYDSFVKENKIF